MGKQLKKPSFSIVGANLFLMFFAIMGLHFSSSCPIRHLRLTMVACQSLIIAAVCFQFIWYLKTYVDYRFQEIEKEIQEA